MQGKPRDGGESGVAPRADVSGRSGTPLRYTDDELSRVLSAQHFVSVRQTRGGPAPSETERALAASRGQLEGDRAWLVNAQAHLAGAEVALRKRSEAL